MSHWRQLLDHTVGGLERLRQTGQPVPEWVLGGGTALMITAAHRISKDIDVFITDPQYLAFLSPRLGGESIWTCEAYDEAPHHLKLIFPEGVIDFIVAAPITDLPTERKTILARVEAISEKFLQLELDELDILENWRKLPMVACHACGRSSRPFRNRNTPPEHRPDEMLPRLDRAA